jgi:hypothetical protein
VAELMLLWCGAQSQLHGRTIQVSPSTDNYRLFLSGIVSTTTMLRAQEAVRPRFENIELVTVRHPGRRQGDPVSPGEGRQ